jgi:aryl-alcohol dehydrogenase-like predicted oxidoreductase
VRFALHHPIADTVLFGSTSLEEMQANLAAIHAGPLPSDLLAAMTDIRVSDPLLLHPGNWLLPSPANPKGRP